MLVHLPSTIILFVDDKNNVSLLLYSRMYLTLVIVIVCHSISFVFLTISLVVTVVTAVFVRLMATKKNDQNTLIVGMRHMPMYVSLITTAGSSTMMNDNIVLLRFVQHSRENFQKHNVSC